MELKIDIDFDKKCNVCGKKGACENGLCLKCTTDKYLRNLKTKKIKQE